MRGFFISRTQKKAVISCSLKPPNLKDCTTFRTHANEVTFACKLTCVSLG